MLTVKGLPTDLVEGPEDVGVEELAANAPVQPLDVGVLRRLAVLDVGQRDAAILAPRVEPVADELRPLVDADHPR
nr:hypothetical protein [Rubrivirga sp. SAORIC476]